MNATNQNVIDALSFLLTELADREIEKGAEFKYEGQALLAMDVAEMGLNSTLALADHLHRALGLGDTGLSFTVLQPGETLAQHDQFFPLIMDASSCRQTFPVMALMVSEIFKVEVMDCRADLYQLFQRAANEVGRVQSLRIMDAPLPAAILPLAAEARALMH